MLWPDVEVLLNYWRSHPPVHVSTRLLLGAYTDWKPQFKARPMTEDDIVGISEAMGSRPNNMPQHIKDRIAWAEKNMPASWRKNNA